MNFDFIFWTDTFGFRYWKVLYSTYNQWLIEEFNNKSWFE